jgi:hypothetical protein
MRFEVPERQPRDRRDREMHDRQLLRADARPGVSRVLA